jgi:hypothetical protein
LRSEEERKRRNGETEKRSREEVRSRKRRRDVIPTFNSKGFPENKVTSKLIARKFERKNSIS